MLYEASAVVEQEKELWGHTFKLVNRGLDEAEVYSFVESLIGQYGNLAKRLEHLESVTGRLDTSNADHSTGADRRTKPSGRDPHTSRTNGLGDPADLEKLQNLDALTSFAERTVIEAAKHARSIETEATERAQAVANRIIADALHQASTQMAWVLSQSQPGTPPPGHTPSTGPPPARAVADEMANPTSERQSLPLPADALDAVSHLRQHIQDLMQEITTLDPDQTKEAFESLCDRLLPLLDNLSGEPAGPPSEGEEPEPAVDGDTEPPQPEGQPQEGSDESLFDGTVELALPPPVALDRMLQLHKHLKETPHVDVLNLGGSVDNGITIRILVDSPLPLLKILQELPEADHVAEELPGDKKAVPSRDGAANGHVRRVVITAKA